MAFQITDDVLDLSGGADAMGKPLGSDLRQGLATLPVLLFLESGIDTEPVRRVLDGERGEASVAAALEAIRDAGALEQAMAEARLFTARARKLLDQLTRGPANDGLVSLLDYVVTRQS